MRYLLILPFVLGYTMTIFGQSVSPLMKTPPRPASHAEWDLSKYIWSHTHPKLAKGEKHEKHLLDFDVIDNWKEVGDNRDVAVSSDGKYVSYRIVQGFYKFRTLVIQSTSDSWKQEFPLDRSGPGFFSADSKQYIFLSKDTLRFLRLSESKPAMVTEVASFKKPLNGKNEWLAWQEKNSTHIVVLKNLLTGKEERFDNANGYNFDFSSEWLAVQLDNETKELVLYNLQTGSQQWYPSVIGYVFAQNGKALLLKTAKRGNGTSTGLQYANLEARKVTDIWPMGNEEDTINSYSINADGKQVVFVVQGPRSKMELGTGEGQGDKAPQHFVWCWQEGMDKPVMRTDEEKAGIDVSLFIQNASFFFNGSYIILTLQQRANSLRPQSDAVQLDVWSYKDTVLQSMQPDQLKKQQTYKAIINTEGKIIAREDEFFKIKAGNEHFMVVGKIGKEINGDRFWEPGYNIDSNWLVSLKDGSRKFLATEQSRTSFVRFSPGGRYVVYFDAQKGCNYFSVDLQTGKLANISAGVPAWQLGRENRYQRPHEKPTYWVGITAWLQGDKGLLVYDDYDIWQLDLSGRKQPANITHGYGRTHGIMFYLRGNGPYRGNISFPPILSEREVLLLQAFNIKNMQSGVYQKVLGETGNPKQLFMGTCRLDVLGAAGCLDELHLGSVFMKKDGLPSFIVKRQSATEAPNYFYTNDFKIYRPITNFHQQQQYNWLTAELHSFKQLDGTVSQGILYKPENFDPAKKYPVIISFYASLTDQLYQFPTPGYLDRPSIFDNPAWFVSHGYLVFLPDIYFIKGKWGPSALNTVDGAAKYVSTLPFVDAKHIAASGHSNSGRTAYYILTHSHSFAAMAIGSGTTNIISTALSLDADVDGKESMLYWAEVAALGTGLGNLWQNKASWLDQSSVLSADKVTSPVLMYACKKNDVPVSQAVEMFTSLRRLGKKAWWLQYDNGGHILSLQKDKRDFTIRYTQFFDHYLKGAPAPEWMTQGVPYKLKGIESRYELDPNGSCGMDCPVCKKYKASKLDK